MKTVGIDPGLSGGVALLNVEAGKLLVWPVPTVVVGKGRKSRERLDEPAMLRLAGLIASMSPDIVALEGVGGLPRQSAHRAFVFGDLCGAIRMAFFARGLTVHRPPAVTWKAAYGLKGGKENKDEARALASKLYPHHQNLWARKSDDGLAEAVLLADYAAHRMPRP